MFAERDQEAPRYIDSINGSVAGAISGFLTTPFDVLKTRRMTFTSIDKKK